MDNVTPYQFGQFLACAEYGVSAEMIPFMQGINVKAASADVAPAARLLVKAAADVMEVCGYKTAAAHHLRLISEHPDWNSHCHDVHDNLIRTIQVLAPLEKHAFADAVSAGGAAVRGVGYGSLAAGAGLGSLYWMLSRHANQDEAGIQSKQQQIDYYNRLSAELNESMKRKYRYQDPKNGKYPKV